ncbi:MAG: VWA domain-containing protein, partial [Acidobacteria bacterium]|nr:VWA domain-containing protein [Acidobacteriota bacterium]
MKAQSALHWVVAALLGWVLVFPSDMASQAPSATVTAGTAQAGLEPAGGDPAAIENPADEQEPTFQVEIEEVTVPVTVTDSDGEFVTDLNPGDFRLRDEGGDQRIENFELSWEPVSMVVVVETSTRVQSQLEEIGRTGILFTQLIMGESGEAAVITFDREIKLVQEFTEDPDLVEAALKNLKPG